MTSDEELLAARDYFSHQFDGSKVVPLLDELLDLSLLLLRERDAREPQAQPCRIKRQEVPSLRRHDRRGRVMDSDERDMRNLLLEYGAVFQRRTAGSNEIWHLPGGAVFVCGGPGKRGDSRAWRNNLARLRRMLPKTKPNEVELQRAANAPPPRVNRVAPAWSTTPPDEPAPQFNAPRLAIAPPQAEPPQAPKEQEMKNFEKDRWTPEQDKALREAIEAGMSWAEVAQVVADVRKGVSTAGCMQRWQHTKKKKDQTMQRWKPEPKAAPVPPAQSDELVAVTFTIGATRRVLNVDRATAERMITLAVSL